MKMVCLFVMLSAWNIASAQSNYYDVTAGDGYGIRFWYYSGSDYKIHMGNGSEYHYGPVTDYSIKTNMSNGGSRGWVWGEAGATPVAAINTLGNMQLGGSMSIGLLYNNSGSDALTLSGSNAGLSFVNRAVSSFIYSPTQGERWSIYNNGTATDGKLRFWSGNDVMVLTKEGNVGIGTSSPDQKLTVNGTVHATRVKVETTVPAPDYVFEQSYALLTLDEVKSYIDENKHLPEVPSAKEMEVKGIDVGEMNMLLLKKVEELTLYVIELKKLNEATVREMDKMKSAFVTQKK